MFVKAIENAYSYVRIVFKGVKYFDNEEIDTTISPIIVLNKDGWILTTRCIANTVFTSERVKYDYDHFCKDNENVSKRKFNKNLMEYKKDHKVEIQRNIFMDAFVGGKIENILFHEYLDMALIKWKDFTSCNVKKFPVFRKNDSKVGEMLCKIGFSYPVHNTFIKKDNDIDLNDKINFMVPFLPLDGMVSRVILDSKNKASFLELTNNVTINHLGGPVIDDAGYIVGLMFGFAHVDLMMDVNMESKRGAMSKKIDESQLMPLNVAINASTIKEFLNKYEIKYIEK